MAHEKNDNARGKQAYAKYVSPTGELEARELRFGEWYVRHKIQLQHIGKWALITWCALTLGFSLWQWGEYAFVGYRNERTFLEQSRAGFKNYDDVHALYGASDITVSRVQIFRSGAGKYDFSAFVANPNAQYAVILRYQFAYAGGATVIAETTLLPNERRPVVVFGHEAAQFPSSARFVVEEKRFRRVDPHDIPNVAGFIEERLAFNVSNITISSGHVSFDVLNNSAYSYWQAVFYVQLVSGDTIVGLLYLPLDQFRSGEKRSRDIRLFSDGENIRTIQLSPIINVFDQSVFMSPGA